jgi:hypothetical protein
MGAVVENYGQKMSDFLFSLVWFKKMPIFVGMKT